MSKERISERTALHVYDTCLCLHVNRAARALARHFDDAFRPLELTNWQFSLLMSLLQPVPPTIGEVASLLAVDRTTLTAALKPLQRRGLVAVKADPADRRRHRVMLRPAGRKLLSRALPVWRQAHGEIDRLLGQEDRRHLRRMLGALAAHATPHQGRASAPRPGSTAGGSTG